MVHHCSAFGCNRKSTKGDTTSFHCFPSDVELRKKWVKASGRMHFTPSPHSRICSRHFSKNDIVIRFGSLMLARNAVPSLNLSRDKLENIEDSKHNKISQINTSLSENRTENGINKSELLNVKQVLKEETANLSDHEYATSSTDEQFQNISENWSTSSTECSVISKPSNENQTFQ